MAKTKLYLSLIVCNLLSGATLSDWTQLPAGGISENTTGNFTYSENQTQNFVLQNSIFFTNSNAHLNITTNISGNWKAHSEGLIFCDNNKALTFNKGNITLFINSNSAQNIETGYFQLSNNATLDINANLHITASMFSDFSNSLFNIKNSTLNISDADLYIDLSNNENPNTLLLYLDGTSKSIINNGGNKLTQSIILKGGIETRGTSNLELNLLNTNSYLQGSIVISENSHFLLNLSSSSAIFTTYSENTTQSSIINLSNHSTLGATLIGNHTKLNLSKQSIWNMWGQNNTQNILNMIQSLVISDSTINFLSNQDGTSRLGQPIVQKKLTAEDISGNGKFSLYADITNKTVDTTEFTSAKGEYALEIFYNPTTFSQQLAQKINANDNMVVSTINDPNSTIIFTTLPVDMGLTSYTTQLKKITNPTNVQWVIANIASNGESPLTKALTTSLNTPYRLFELSSQTLNLRLGDLRNYPKDFGLFFHYTIAQNDFKEDTNLITGKDLFMSMVGGFDMNALYKGHDDFFGFGFEINLMDTTTDVFTSESQSYGGFLYYTSIWNNRFYYDIVLKYAYMPTDINLGSLASSTSFSAHLLNLSAEVGKKFAFNSNKSFAYIEPQAKLTSGFISSASLDTQDPNSIAIKAETDFQFPLLIKSSLYFGYEWNGSFIGDIKVGAFIDYSLFNGVQTTLSDQWSKFEKNFDMDFDVGVSIISNITLKDYLRFYLQFDTSFMGIYTHDILFNAGIRWSFGDRYVPPPPPPKDPNRLKVRKLKGTTIRDIPTVRDNDRGNMKHYEGNRNNIIDSYPQSSTPQSSTPQGESEENGNTNRFYPRDYYNRR